MIGTKAAAVRLAPPTSAPSTSPTAKSSAALAALTEPPVAQERRNGPVRGRAGEPVVLPEEQVAPCPRSVVERIGSLDEGRLGRGLRQPQHQGSSISATCSSAWMMGEKSEALRLAPPTSAPSTSGIAKISAAFDGLTLPP